MRDASREDGQQEIIAAQLEIVIVTFQRSSYAAAYANETGLPFTLLVDEERQLYRAYAMGRGKWRKLLGPAVWIRYLKLMASGRRLHRATADVRQLGGNVLVDPEGIVRLHVVGESPAERPTVEQILEPIRARMKAESGSRQNAGE